MSLVQASAPSYKIGSTKMQEGMVRDLNMLEYGERER